MDDKTLVERCRAGDEAAFAELVHSYAGRAYQIAYGVVGNREDAEEVAQDVFIRIHRALPHFRGDCAFSTWLYRIALNLARNKYRWNKARGAQLNFSLDAPLDCGDGDEGCKLSIDDGGLSPEKQSELSELQSRLEREMQALPEAYREILIMRNVQDMSYEEIANVLGCQLGTVKSRLARARDELKQRLEAAK